MPVPQPGHTQPQEIPGRPAEDPRKQAQTLPSRTDLWPGCLPPPLVSAASKSTGRKRQTRKAPEKNKRNELLRERWNHTLWGKDKMLVENNLSTGKK